MKKVVWTGIIAGITFVSLGVGPAAAQDAPRTQRQLVRAMIQKRINRQFRRLDQNGNGVIDRSEWTRNPRLFDRFDRDHDGVLSPQEFRRLVIAVALRRR